MKRGICLFASFVLFLIVTFSQFVSVTSTIKLINVVFRHGDRTPEKNSEFYPNDPYLNDNFYPVGLGQLTNAGKRREYTLGVNLRNRYNEFLGPIYYPPYLSAQSTDIDRTKMSLQLVLSGLYPPVEDEVWSKNINWQPIPYNYTAWDKDYLLRPEENCPQYVDEYYRIQKTPEVREMIKKFKPIMEQLTQLTGKQIKAPMDLYALFLCLTAESSMGLKLPEWTEDYFSANSKDRDKYPLYKGILLEYRILSYNTKLKRLNGGMILRRIIQSFDAATRGEIDKGSKINLYSGHETNVASLLSTLGVFKPAPPAFGSAVITELDEIDGQHYVNVVHYFGIPEQFETLRIPGCSEPCPYEQFKKLLDQVIPSDEEVKCNIK